IGNKGLIPWHFKEDFRQFKEKTLGKKILMGKVTFDGIGKPLPGRHSIVACFPGGEGQNSENVTYITDLMTFLKENRDTEEEIVVCGGAGIYRIALPYCRKLYISLVEGRHEADAFFPFYDVNDYDIVSVTPYEGFKVIEYEKKDI
ncbi:MAG: dihydrofolate reductase, partial [Erysipelotrichaceae bacterium]|nr:dihydrofolate reductase [Erysipelotrichaceae bacterium]